MVAGAMPHFSPVSCTLLNVSAWIFFGSFCLTNNWLYFTQKERILFAFMPHWTGSSSIQRPNVSQYHNMHVLYALLNAFWLLKFFSRPERCLLGCLGGNYEYLKRVFVSSKTVTYPNESSRTFSRHDSSELLLFIPNF